MSVARDGFAIGGSDLLLASSRWRVSAGYLYEASQIPAEPARDAVGARGVPVALGWCDGVRWA